MRKLFMGLLAVLLTPAAVCVWAEEAVIRHPMPTDFPIASAVEVPASASLVVFSGAVPPLQDRVAGNDQFRAYAGDTEDQTVGVIQSLEHSLERLGLGLGDIVKMQVYLVGDPHLGGKMDFAGFMRGYAGFFGTSEQPKLPARSVFQVVALADPSWLVEIEVIAVRQAQSLH